MANKTLSTVTQVTSVSSDDTLICEQSGSIKRVSVEGLTQVIADGMLAEVGIRTSDLMSYGVSWNTDVADPILTRTGNMYYHKTRPIQDNMKGCIAQMKDGCKIMYYLNATNWRWRADERGYVLTSKAITASGSYFVLTDDVFTTNQYLYQYIRINGIPCKVTAIDTSTGKATISPESTLTAGTYDVTLGACLNGYDGEVMVEVPEFWIKSWISGTYREVRVAPQKVDDTWEYQPRCLVGAYKDTLISTSPDADVWGYLNTLSLNSAVSICNRSTFCRGGGNRSAYDTYFSSEPFRSDLQKPRTNISRANMRNYMRLSGKEILNYLQYKRIIYWLYVIEYANFNSQATFNANLTSEGYRQGGLGEGPTNMLRWDVYNVNYPVSQIGYTNTITSGTDGVGGNGTGKRARTLNIPNSSTDATTTTLSYSNIRWHGIENPFGDIWTNLDGVIIKSYSTTIDGVHYGQVYATDNPSYYSDSDTSHMKIVGYEYNEHTGDYIKEYDLGTTAEIIPSVVGGSSVTYKCDTHYCSVKSQSSTLLIGGCAAHSSHAGLAYFYSSAAVSYSGGNFGFRSIYVINN